MKFKILVIAILLSIAASAHAESKSAWQEPRSGIDFVWVPGGCYQMGLGGSLGWGAKPVHEVCLRGFWMGKYEVTKAQWEKVMEPNESGYGAAGNLPAGVTWFEAKAFIKKLNDLTDGKFILPSEAQWEYAARSGGKREIFSGSNKPWNVAWFGGNSGESIKPVGLKSPNGLGLHDMSGNVMEWCEDVYDNKAYQRHERNNPIVLSPSGGSRIARGGFCATPAKWLRVTQRSAKDPGDHSSKVFYGFRIITALRHETNPNNIEHKLIKLKKLYEKNLITEEEYQKQKSALLEDL